MPTARPTVRRVRAGTLYTFLPVGMDRWRPASSAATGQTVRVVRLRGCPPPNAMGHAHIQSEDGTFLGLVLCNSLTRD